MTAQSQIYIKKNYNKKYNKKTLQLKYNGEFKFNCFNKMPYIFFFKLQKNWPHSLPLFVCLLILRKQGAG